MQVDPCNVCGSTEVNLVDGYYYCIECGTQDVTARQTIIEHQSLADGTFGIARTKKFSVALRKDGIKMSGEWYKWHAYNFVLAGMAEEMIAAGAKPSFKAKLLWIWTRYIKKYQKKGGRANSSKLITRKNNSKLSHFGEEDDISDCNNESESEEREQRRWPSNRNIKILNRGILMAMMYAALNLDGSDIQLSHLFQFIREGRLDLLHCTKYVPEEINVKSIPLWNNFLYYTRPYRPFTISRYAKRIFKVLDLGKPLTPDMKKILDNFIKEMCLPNDFKEVVLSLMEYAPYDFSVVGNRSAEEDSSIPNYEVIVMSYVLFAFKMCFGLDDDYEIKLSDAVDKINSENDYTRSHKLGNTSNSTDRLFSFREWCNYLQFRKKILCKYNLTLAEINDFDVNDYVFMEHSNERLKGKRKLIDDIHMEMLKKIPYDTEKGVIPKNEFPLTLTPFFTYTELILQYIQDSDLKILLSEDFSRYSLKYACKDLNLQVDSKNIITGIKRSNKNILNRRVHCVGTDNDLRLVYVRNCENKNWLKTKRPTKHHIKIKGDSHLDEENDYDDSESEDTSECEDANQDDEKNKRKIKMIDVEQEGINIFDDAFEDVDEKEEKVFQDENSNIEVDKDFQQIEDKYFEDENMTTKQEEEILQDYSVSQENEHDSINRTRDNFNPDLFDRDNIIKSLVLDACEKYKVPIPYEYSERRSVKRKAKLANNETGESNAKKRKRPAREKKKADNLLAKYYKNVEQEILSKLAEEMESLFNVLINQNESNESDKVLAEDSSVIYESNELCDTNKNNSLQGEINPTTDQDMTLNQENDFVEQESNSSVVVVNNVDNEKKGTENSKDDPKFDEKTFDIEQLYLKLQDEINLDEIIYDNNSEVDKILNKQLKEYNGTWTRERLKSTTSDSEEDIPLHRLQQRKRTAERQKEIKSKLRKLEPLVKRTHFERKFHYWIRNYGTRIFKSEESHSTYELELENNYPKSFTFVIHECATVAGCSSFTLLKLLQHLEQAIFHRLGKLRTNRDNLKF